MTPVLLLAALLLLIPPPPAPVVEEVPVAVTIDDLPWIGLPEEDRLAGTERLLAALTKRGVRATGFVNCDRAREEDPILERWLAAGMELGNHSASHPDLNRTELGAWLADVRRCDGYLRALTGEPARWFRFPFLHEGPTRERRDAVTAELEAMGYEKAHVSIDTSDWLLAMAYRDAVARGDAAEAERVGRAHVEHVVTMARHYRAFARQRFDRDVSHVLLLHANLLNSDWLDEVLDALAAEGFRFAPLEEALADPVYDMPDGFVGPDGISWLYRAAPATLGGAFDQAREDEIRQRFGVR